MIKRAMHRRHAVDRGEKTKLSKILVTGGTDCFGSRVVERLRDAGGGVRAISRSGRDGTIRPIRCGLPLLPVLGTHMRAQDIASV
jgi:nucleoside-diphosphate-sugar epimerase